MSVNSTDSHRPKQFLADLVQAMGEAAISAREAALDQCHSDARAYTERLRVGTSGGTGDLHRAAVTDVRTIREQSKAYSERVRIQTEELIAHREQQLEEELRLYQSAIETEIDRVGERIQAFEAEVGQFFEQLLRGTDPLSLVTIAARMPNPPAFVDPDPAIILRGSRQGHGRGHGQAPRAESTDRSRMDPGMAFAPRTNSRPRSGQQG
jgi:hypothetical protein